LVILTFTNRHGREIGDYPQDFEPRGDDDDSDVEHLQDVYPGVETDFDTEPAGV
jgi:hypothetical protein